QDPGLGAHARAVAPAQSARAPDAARRRGRRAGRVVGAGLRVDHGQRDPRRRRGGHRGMNERNVTIDLNPREKRFYDRVRSTVVAPHPGERSNVRDALLLLPDLTVLLFRLLRDPRVPVGGKAIALLGVGYVLSPVDLVPEALLGPIGLMDDLMIVAATLSRIVNYVHPDVVRSHWP